MFANFYDQTETEVGFTEIIQILGGGTPKTSESTYWNGNVLTDASDGILDVYVYYTWNGTELYPWLQKRSHWEEQPEGEVFVYIHGNDYPLTGRHCEQEDHLAWSNGEGSIYIYDSAAEVDALQRGQWSETDASAAE